MAELLLTFAADSSEKLAVADEFGSTDWKNFNERVNQLIHALRGQGLKNGDAFSVLSGNRSEFASVLIAGVQCGPTRYRKLDCPHGGECTAANAFTE